MKFYITSNKWSDALKILGPIEKEANVYFGPIVLHDNIIKLNIVGKNIDKAISLLKEKGLRLVEESQS